MERTTQYHGITIIYDEKTGISSYECSVCGDLVEVDNKHFEWLGPLSGMPLCIEHYAQESEERMLQFEAKMEHYLIKARTRK